MKQTLGKRTPDAQCKGQMWDGRGLAMKIAETGQDPDTLRATTSAMLTKDRGKFNLPR